MPTLAEMLGMSGPQGLAQSQNPTLQALIAAALKKRQMEEALRQQTAPMIGVRG